MPGQEFLVTFFFLIFSHKNSVRATYVKHILRKKKCLEQWKTEITNFLSMIEYTNSGDYHGTIKNGNLKIIKKCKLEDRTEN